MERLRNAAGFTLIELLVAAGLLLLLTALTCRVLADAHRTIGVIVERADVHQRARVAVDVLGSQIRAAGVGADRGHAVGPLVRWAPPLLPGRPGGDAREFSTAVTTLEVVALVRPATLAFDVPAGTATLDFDFEPGCAAPCGFAERMTVALVGAGGDFDVFVLTSIAGGSATVRRTGVGTGGSYVRGTPALPVDLRSYYLSDRNHELRVFDGDRSDLPVVNDVVEVAFEYLADDAGGGLSPVSAAEFRDGPWRGSGSEPFDADLLRIRTVRLTVRLQASNAAKRGADSRWFRNPGTGIDASHLVEDVTVRTTITPPNLAGPR